MSDTRVFPEGWAADDDRRRSALGEELLPPVEPPSAGFIVQLFIVPAVIVLLIVGVWLTVSWLVHRTRPDDLVKGLEGSGIARWQRASELADILRSKRFASFKRDSNAASTLAAILKREIEAGGSGDGMTNEYVMLRFFLCRALGEFEVREGLDELLLAAETNRDPAERWVRRGAIQALAVRVFSLRQLAPSEELDLSSVEATLARLAEDSDPLIRSETAYALGRIGTPVCLARLEVMVDDPHADTRYNAAVALAHLGNAKAVGTLAEMLEPIPLASVLEELEKQSQSRQRKRATILHNAMEAAAQLAEQNPAADMSPIIKSLDEIVKADVATLESALIPREALPDVMRTLELLRTGE
ncbi:MAG: HEAT repeat domain-containing protein [Pirellulales bacterium]